MIIKLINFDVIPQCKLFFSGKESQIKDYYD